MVLIRFFLAGLSVCSLFFGQARGGELSDEAFGDLRRRLAPELDERWRSIPWRTSLVEAQREAGRRGGLIFIWAMDGHPLGCT